MSQKIPIAVVISGVINRTLPRALNSTIYSLRSVQRQAMATGLSLNSMGRGLLGLTAGYAAYSGIKRVLAEGLALTKQTQNLTILLNTEIRNRLQAQGQSVTLAGQEVDAIKKQALYLQQQTGQYKNIYLQGAAVLAQSRMSAEQIQQLLPHLANVVLANKQLGKSSAVTNQVFQAVAKSVVGMGRNLLAVGIMLNPLERKMMVMRGTMNGVAGNVAAIIHYIDRMYKGDADAFRKSLMYRADLAQTRMMQWKEDIGAVFLPLQVQFTILQSKLFDLFGPYMIQAMKMFAAGFDTLSKYLDKQWPIMKKLVRDGWDRLIGALKWFNENKGWLVPLLITIVKWTLAWKVANITLALTLGPIIKLLEGLRIVLGVLGVATSGPWGLVAIAAGIAAYAVLTHWKQVGNYLAHLWEWIVGTKVFNADARGGVVTMRALDKNAAWKPTDSRGLSVYRAQAIQPGLLASISGDPTASWGKEWAQDQKNWEEGWKSFWKELNQDKKNWDDGWSNFFKFFTTDIPSAVKITGQAIEKWLIKPMQDLGDRWHAFMKWLGVGDKGTNPLQFGGTGVNRANPSGGTGSYPAVNLPYSSAIKSAGAAMQFGGVAVKSADTSGYSLYPAVPLPFGSVPETGSTMQFGGVAVRSADSSGYSLYPAVDMWSGEGIKPTSSVNYPGIYHVPGTFDAKSLSGYDSIFNQAGAQYGIDPKLLKAIAMQEGVAPGDMNPLGISPNNGPPTHFANMAAAQAAIMRQTALMSAGIYQHVGPYKGVRTIDDLARIYSPVGAPNDPYRTNSTEGSGIKKYYRQLRGTGYNVTINSNPVYHINGGGADVQRQVATAHRQHIDDLKRDLEEVHHRIARASFVNNEAWT